MDKSPIVYVLLAKPGGGKETVQKQLRKTISALHKKECFFSDTGHLFRCAIKDDPTTIIRLNSYNKGRLADIQHSGKLQCAALATAMWVSHFLLHYKGESFVVIDGSPRRQAEADTLLQFLDEYLEAEIRFVYITVDDDTVINRMLERHKTNPRIETSSREAIELRLREFDEKNRPVIESLYSQHPQKFITIDNNGTLDDLERQVSNLFSP